jgi:SPP1 gp7 family putative phage head morphogenesis protein
VAVHKRHRGANSRRIWRSKAFKQFREAVDSIGETYNKTWLRTEYELSVSNAQNASQWDSFERDKKVLPFLKYQTVGDARVRDSHKRLDGIIRRVDDKFWNSYAPANGYNCRCMLVQLENAKESDVSGLEFTDKEVPKEFRFNPAKKKRIYPKDHPYYEVSTKYRDDKNNNFNLPIRP